MTVFLRLGSIICFKFMWPGQGPTPTLKREKFSKRIVIFCFLVAVNNMI